MATTDWFGRSGVTLLSEGNDASSSGLVCAALKQALAQDCRVMLVTVGTPRLHYKRVMRKMGVSLNSASTATHTLDLLQRSKEHERGIDHVDADFVVRLIKQAWAALRAGPAAGLRAVLICDDWSMLATLLQDDSAQVLSVFAAVLDMVLTDDGLASALIAVNADISAHRPWRTLMEASADTVVRLEALPTGKLAEDNVRVTVSRPNRWGRAGGVNARGVLELEERLFAQVTERGVHMRHAG